MHTFVLGDAPEIRKLPDTVGRLTALVNLKIECGGLIEPPSRWRLGALRKLELTCNFTRKCRFHNLPHSMFHGFGELVELTISRFSCLQRLPGTLGRLTSLEKLTIAECWQFKNLPTSISNVTRLKILLIQKCRLRDMPCIEALTELHTLELVVSDYSRTTAAAQRHSRRCRVRCRA